jgi:hypothetical protein
MKKTSTNISSNKNQNLNQNYGTVQSSILSIRSHEIIITFSFIILCLICLTSEVSLATALSDQLTTVETTMNQAKKIILPATAVFGGGGALATGNVKMAAMITVICIVLAVVIAFVGGDMALTK